MARRAAARSLRPRKSNRPANSKLFDQKRHLSLQALERREMLVGELGPQLISVAANSGENFRLNQSNVLLESPTQLTFRFDGSQQIDPETLSAITIQRSGGDASFGEGNEIRITPGFLGFGDSQRIVIARFAETLPDDQYRISIAGYDDTNNGIVGLRNTNGELFQPLNPASASAPVQNVNFQIELGPQVVAVVPQPITGVGASRVQQRRQIHVYFNNDPLSNPALGPITSTGSPSIPVVNPNFYNLFFTNGTVENVDDGAAIRPTLVTYDPSLNMATLEFSTDLALLPQAVAAGGSATYRLRVGSSQALPAAPTQLAETGDTGNLFNAARNVGTTFGATPSSVVISGQIEPTVNNHIQWPGFNSPGVRDNRTDAQITGQPDTTNGINRYYYNFAQVYGSVSSGGIQNNAITPAQKQRAREVLSLYADHLGVEFIETEDRGLQIVTGVLRALVDTAITGPGLPLSDYRINDTDPTRGVLILDSGESWFDGYGLSPDGSPSWFVEALRGVGSLLGLGSTYEQVPGVASGSNPALYGPSLFPAQASPQFSIEPDFLSSSDIIPGQAMHRPETRDVDLYRFDVAAEGQISIETFAQRLDDTSSLNSDLKLWKRNSVTGQYDLIARNDDFYSLDSFIGLDVSPNADGTTAQYVIGITATGNDDYNPNIAGSGSGGRSQGAYRMRVTFENKNAATIRDTDGSVLDGDGDGLQGGDFNFWFRTAKTKDTAAANESRTLFVDKNGVNSVSGGTIAAPYRSIDFAFSQARPGDIVRILPSAGNDNLLGTLANNPAYEIGRGGSTNAVLSDGETFNVPKGVTVMIDAGAILKLRNAKISVGSERIDEDRSLAALQVLGVPVIVDSNGTRISGEVRFTSYNDETLGIDTNSIPTTATAGDWAGIEFRNDFDYSEGRAVWETEGIFIDYASHANIRYGGGSISSNSPIVTPLQMLEARPTLIYNTIRNSRDAAISADPNSFLETNFHAPIYQRAASFTSDYDRVGPDLRGNTLTQNSNNGLFVRVRTPAAGQREPQTVSGRFDDRDIVHAISDVLVLQGQPGGSILLEQRPDVLSVTVTAPLAPLPPTGTLTVGQAYDYRVTFINSDGSESLASLPTSQATAGANRNLQLSNLPSTPTEFVGRRLYRRDPSTGNYVFVTQLDRSTQTYLDTGFTRGGNLPAAAIAAATGERLLPRFDARLSVDPGLVVKLNSARIEAAFGSDFYAEGTDGNPIVFTSRLDDTYGAGGTFDTNNDGDAGSPVPGNWGGLVFRQGSTASLDYNVIRFAGGTSATSQGEATFNPVEILQADVRVAHSLFSDNASGGTAGYDTRDNIGFNGPATIFVRGAQPIIVANTIRDNAGAAISINPDALNYVEVTDTGRSTGQIDRFVTDNDNQGPLIAANKLNNNLINGMVVRNESLTTESVWDDTEIVHVVEGQVYAWNHHHRSGLRLKSDPNQSLVVKFNTDGAIYAGRYRNDTEDAIGGTVQVLGQAGFPVIMTSLHDDTVGAGFTPAGLPQNDTDNLANAPIMHWYGIVIQPGANDRNVAFVPENEQAIGVASGLNAIPSTAQVLGSLARSEFSSDDNRRSGFNVRGTLSQNSDLDVYTFFANGGTEVFFDIDDTTFGLDTVVELIDSQGNILAQSNNSNDESNTPSLLVNRLGSNFTPANEAVFPLYKSGAKSVENPNPLDAGFRAVLNGSSASLNQYYVRVRSNNNANGAPTLPSSAAPGLSHGQYQLSIRLRETDEIAGSTVRLADIRFATNAIDMPSAPSNSPLSGEHAEELNAGGFDVNDGGTSFNGSEITSNFNNANADPLGSLNASNRGVLRVSGFLGNQFTAVSNGLVDPILAEGDLDVYRVNILDDNQNPDIIGENRFVSTVFDIDYADTLGRANTSISVYNSAGRLILHSRDSNIADDQGRPLLGVDMENLGAGSAGSLDAYIGPVELQVGTYYVVVSSAQMIPQSMDQLFLSNPTDTNVRVLPINSQRNLAEFGFNENPVVVNGPAITNPIETAFLNQTAELPVTQPFFDNTSIVPYTLEDVRMFLSLDGGLSGTNQSTLISINPFTGQLERTIGQFGQPVGDLAMRRDGELFGYSHGPQTGNQDNGNTGNFLNISAVDASASSAGDDGLSFRQSNAAGNGTENANPDGAQFIINAIAFTPIGFTAGATPTGDVVAPNGNNRAYIVGDRDNFGRGGELPDALRRNVVYSVVETSGDATNQGSTNGQLDRNFPANTPLIENFGAGSNKQEFGIVDVGQFALSDPLSLGSGGSITGLAQSPNFGASLMWAVTDAGGVYSFSPFSTRTVDVNLDGIDSYNRVINSTYFGDVVRDPQHLGIGAPTFSSLTFGPRSTEGRRYENVLFATTTDGWIYTFTVDASNKIQPAPVLLNGRSAIQITTPSGGAINFPVTGVAFTIREENPWHTTPDRSNPFGVTGPNATTNIHGVNFSHDQSRITQNGGTSLYFGFEPNNTITDNTLNDSPNGNLAPGGVHGSTVSRPFSLEGYNSGDKPTLYFNYYLETEDNADFLPPNRAQVDSFRVFAAGDDGQWRLVSTNDTWRSFSNVPASDEYDYFALNGGIPVQETFENTDVWRQARVDLSPLAGNKNVQLRFDFSTAGAMQGGLFGYVTEIQAVAGRELVSGTSFSMFDTDAGNFGTFEFTRGIAINIPDGDDIVDGQTITIVRPNNTSIVLTLTTGVPLPANQIGFARGESGASIANKIATRLQAIAPELNATSVGNQLVAADANSFSLFPQRFGHAAVTIPADVSTLDGQSLSFTNLVGSTTTVFLTDVTGVLPPVPAPLPNELQFTTADTAATIATRLRNLFNSLDASLNANSNNDQLIVVNATDLALDPAFTETSSNPGRTDSQYLPNGNVPVFYNRAMTSTQVRDSIRTALANGLGDQSVTGVSQATIANYPGFGTNRIRTYRTQQFANDSVVGFSEFLPGDEFGLGRSSALSTQQISTRGAANNNVEGVYIDDIVVGFAERGEVIYNAPADNRNFVALPEVRTFTFVDTQQPEYPNEILIGGYTLEIRQGAQYGVPHDYDPFRLGLDEQSSYGRSFDTNDRMVEGAVTLIVPSAVTINDGDTFVLSNGSQRVTFEFDSNNSVGAGRVRVPFTPLLPGDTFDRGIDDGGLLATSIRDAINSPQARNVLGILAAGRDGSEAGLVTGNRIDLFAGDTQINVVTGERVRLNASDIQVNPSTGRFIKLDMVAAETPYGRETGRTIPVADQDTRTVTSELVLSSFARATATQYVNGNTDTLVAVGKIGDSVGSGYGNERVPSLPQDDVDILKIFLRAGDRIDLDLDTVAFALGNAFASPRLRVFDEAGTVSGIALRDSGPTNTAGAGEFAPGAQIVNFTAPASGYYYVHVSSDDPFSFSNSFGEYQLTIRPNGLVARDVLMVDYHTDKGDTNVYRDQGQFVIESNFISNFLTTGIRATATGGGPTNAVDDDQLFASTPLDRRPGAAALLRNENTARLLPGAVIVNNVIVSDGATGILFTGDTAPAGDSPAPVPFGRIVNNTVVGTGTGTGISVGSSASPTVLNNIISDFGTGLNVSANSSSTIEGGNAYQDNTTDANIPLASSSFVIASGTPLFQDPANGLYIPAMGSQVVDSSFASSADRGVFFNTVKSPMGIAVSPIIAPSFDAYGIPRFDDPTVTTPSGIGANTAIDRGAVDRADFTRPRAVLVAPQDFIAGEGVQIALGDNDPDASFVRLPAGSPSVSFFEVQLLDPAGSGPDVATITSQSVILTEDGVRLTPDVDYIFGYSDNSRLIRLTPTAGLWRPDSVYEITLNNQDRVRLVLPTGDAINDGDRYIVTDSSGTSGNVSVFEFDSGYVLQVPQTLGMQIDGANDAFVDRDTFTITAPDGTSRTFEINLTGSVSSGNIAINLQSAGTVQQVRDAILAALSAPATATALDLAPRAIDLGALQIGSLQGHAITGTVSGLSFFGVDEGVTAGDQFRYQVGPDDILFEFVFGAAAPTDPAAVAIPIARTSTVDEVAAAVASTLVAQPLGLASARSIGDGRVLVGGTTADVLTLVDTQLTQLGAPGVTGALTLTVPANATAANLEGRTFTVQNGAQSETFVFTVNPSLPTTARRIVLAAAATPNQIAAATASEINVAFAGQLSPSANGRVVSIGEQAAVIPTGTAQVRASVNVGTSTLVAGGVSGGAIAVPFIPTSLFTSAAAAATLSSAISTSPLTSIVSSPGGGTLLFSNTRSIQFQRGSSALTTVGITLPAITDLAGNPVASNRDDSETRFTIIMPEVRFDFGDAPASYGTLFAGNGARHSVGSNATPRLGSVIDTELDGQPSPASDDTVVPISATSPGGSPLFSFASPATGQLNVTINDITPTSGSRLRITINSVSTTFELVTTGIAPLIGNIPVALIPGDTAESIATRLADAIRLELASSGSSLTVTVDPLTPTVIELRTLDDEDGVAIGTFTSGATTYNVFLAPGAPAATIDPADVLGFLNPQDPLGSNVSVTVSGAGLLDAWIDFDGSGTFDDNEQVLANTPVVDGVNTVRVFTPSGTTDKQTWARFRLSTGGNLNPTGVAIGGEVEDYAVQIINIDLPVPQDDTFTVDEDAVLDTTSNFALPSVIENDTVPPTTFLPVRYFVGQQPTNGTLVVTDPTSGRFVYTPAPDFSGIDTFTYRLSTQANAGASAPAGVTFATVTINVRPVNDAPSAVAKTFTTTEDTTITITAAQLLAGAIADANPQYPSGAPALPWDESNQSLTILSIQAGATTINAANAASGPFNTPRGRIAARFNSNSELIDLTYTPTLDLNRDNVTPVGSGPVLDTFSFTVQDDGVLIDPVTDLPLPAPFNRLTATATATIDVAPRNDAPSLTTDNVSVGIVGTTTTATPWRSYFTNLGQPVPVPTEDQSLTVPGAYLLANDLAGRSATIDENNFVNGNDGPLTITSVAAVTAGLVVTLDANGDVVLTPPDDVYGDVIFTYTVVDQGIDEAVDGTRTSNPLTTTGTVTVTLQPINDAPVGFDRSISFTESPDAGAGPAFTFNAARLITGITGETPAVPGDFDPALGTPFNEAEQALRVVAFRTAAGTVDGAADLPGGTGTLTLASDAGGTFELDFVNGIFTNGRFIAPADYNERTPFAPAELLEFLVADDGRTTRPQGGGVAVLSSERATDFVTATITVAQTNDAPVFASPGSINVLERDDLGGTVVASFATGILPGPATALDEIQRQTVSFEIVTAASTVPPGLMAQPPQIAPDGTLTVFPAPDAVGTAVYVFEAVDAELDPGTGQNVPGFSERRTRGTVTINVRPVNDAPRVNPAVLSTSQTQSADEAWAVDNAGTITFTLKEDNTGPLGVISPYIINVRRNPNAIGYERIGLLDTFVAGPANELDSTQGGSQILRLFTFEGTTALGGTVRAISFDSNGEVSQLEYIPPTDFNTDIGGLDSFSFIVQDNNPGGGETFNLGTSTLVENNLTSSARVQFQLNPVNDPPRFNIASPTLSVLEDTGSISFDDFVIDIFAGSPSTAFDEIDLDTGQDVTFSVTAVSGIAGLFSTAPTISPAGTLSFVTAPDAYGQAVLEVRATDNGPDNATRGDIVSSDSQLITINIRPVNDRPSLNSTTPVVYTLNEDALVDNGDGTSTSRGPLIPLRGTGGTIGLLDVFNVGPANEAANITPGGNQSITLSTPIPASTVNGGTLTQERDALGNLIGLRYTPRANFNGTDSFVYGVIDNGVSVDLDGNVRNDFREGFTTVTLQVIARNDAPSFGGAPSVTVLEDATTSSVVGQTVIPNWATNIQAGPAGALDEIDPVTGQSITFTVTPVANNPADLFTVAPTVSPTGTLSFTTAANANGVAVFTVVASDSGVASSPLEFNTSSPPRTFTISVTAVNDPPTFTPGANVTVNEDSGQYNSPNAYATNISPGPADEVAAGQTVRFEITTPASGASLFAPDGEPEIIVRDVDHDGVPTTPNRPQGFLVFTPADNASGSVVVTVEAIDSEGARSAPANLTITIGEVNDVPVANNDTFSGDEDTPQTITLAELLANDIDPDTTSNPAESLTIIGLASTSLSGAAIRVNANGDIEYDPTAASLLQILPPGQTRADTFTYRVRDAAGRTSNQAVVTINVSGVNDAPQLFPDNPTLVPGGQTIVRPLLNDIDIDGTINPASLQITLQPAFGSLVVQTDGTLVYTPFDNFRGQDTIRYTVADNLGLRSEEQTITIDVNQAPVANNDNAGTFRDEAININVAANDSDPDGSLDLDSIQIVTQPVRGTVTVAGGGIVRFLPEPGFTGIDTFQYTIRDNGGRASNVGQVTVQTVGSRLQNPRNFTDVNASGQTSPLDALLIINLLSRSNRNGQGSSIPVLPTDQGPNFYDVDGNLLITAADALRVINQISRENRARLAGGEGEASPVPQIGTIPVASVVADTVVATFEDKEFLADFSMPGDDIVTAIAVESDEEKDKRKTSHVDAVDAAWTDAAEF